MSERPIQRIVEGIADAMLVLDEELRVVGVSRGAEELLGIAASDVRGRRAWEVVPGEDGLLLQSRIGEELQHGRSVEFTDYIPFLRRWMCIQAIPSDHGYLVLLRPCREGEGSIETSRNLATIAGDFAYAYRQSSTGMRPEWFSEGLGRVTGFRAREVRDLEWWIDRIDARDREAYRRAIAGASDGGTMDLEYRVTGGDGQEIWLRDRLRPVFTESGELGRLHGVMFDITARRRDEERLAESRDILRSLIAALPVALVGVDRDDLVTYWNPTAERIFGWSAAEVIGKPYPLVPPDHREEHRLILQDAFQGGKGFAGVETMRQRKDGSMVDVAVWAAPLPSGDGHPSSCIAILLDLTERKKLETQLYQSQKMEAVGRLAGGIAHDFNNLITVVTGQSAMLLESGPLSPEVRAGLVEISEAGDKAALLTRQLLAFSRRQVLQTRVISINDALSEMGRILGRLIGADVAIATELDPDLGYARVDPIQFQQIVMNLVVNARDAMPHGGRLALRTANARIGTEMAARFPYPVRPGDYVSLEVQDTGVGMDPAVQSRIFEPFFTTKGQGKGTGLGLSTVYGIVKQSGGYIWVESQRGRGTTFRVYLPRVQADIQEENNGAAPPAEQLGVGGGRVLLVEDELGVRKLARRVLERNGYEVMEADSGEAAISLARQHTGRIDLLLTDVVMPGQGGPEVFRTLLDERPGLRALFMSGYSIEALDLKEFASQEVSFLGKPFTPDSLRAAVAAALGGSRRAGGKGILRDEQEIERKLRALEDEAGRGPDAGDSLSRAGEICVAAGQRERALRYLGRAIDAYLQAGLYPEAERTCHRIIAIAPSVVRARRTLALIAIGRRDVEAAVARIEDYVRAAMEARQGDLAVRQLRTMAAISRDPKLLAFLGHELEMLGGHMAATAALTVEQGGAITPRSEEEHWRRVTRAALAPPVEPVH